MDISRRRSNDEDGSCTGISMYLSFDAESTMSTACYKTLDPMSDISSMSTLSIVDDEKLLNSTLENQENSQIVSPLKTVKKIDHLSINSPLRPLPKNIMREYKALSSTPSREQLMKNVEVTRGSDAAGCIDLGVAFLGVEDEQPTFFHEILQEELRRGDNKENTIPEGIDGSSLSVSSSINEKKFSSVSTTSSLTGDESETAISVIEKRLLNSASTAGSLLPEDSVDEIITENISEGIGFVEDNIENTPKAMIIDKMLDIEMKQIQNVLTKDSVHCIPKTNAEGIGRMGTITEDETTPIELTPKAVVLKEPEKMKTAAIVSGKPKIPVRRSICEPNLQTNKPSRISMSGNKRQSLVPVSYKKATPSIAAENEIPLLMSKILKITSSSDQKTEENTEAGAKKDECRQLKPPTSEIVTAIKKLPQPIDKRRSLMPPNKGRTSLASSSVGEKRPFSFTHRMSVVVKTTLNSPARKIARKSILGATSSLTPQQRRSMVATKSTQTMRMNKIDSGVRKSMFINSKPNTRLSTNPLASVKENATAQQQRKTMFPLTKLVEEETPKMQLPTTSSVRPKEEPSFVCNVCKDKFRVKSILDAHKRSHEVDIVAATNTKPTTSTGGVLKSNPNQCKYCDKKFALVRALHIHLLQNCSKIPPTEKRKLEFTEMNHVEKARLPSVFHQASGTSGKVSSTQATPRGFTKHNGAAATQIPKITVETVKEKDLPVNKTEVSYPNVNATQAAAVSNQKPKRLTAHSGVYRTPSKAVPCHICKLTFKSILDYTIHSLATHGSKTGQQDKTLNGDIV